MKKEMKEFIDSLVDASIPEEQQSFLLTGGILENIDGTNYGCKNQSRACATTNYGCTNIGDFCYNSTNENTCTNVSDTLDPKPDPEGPIN